MTDVYSQTRRLYVLTLIGMLKPDMPKEKAVPLMDRIERHLTAMGEINRSVLDPFPEAAAQRVSG